MQAQCRQRGGSGHVCQESYHYCGKATSSGGKYPDTKPMGYPFVRPPFAIYGHGFGSNGKPSDTLEAFTSSSTNMMAITVNVYHNGPLD